MLEVVDNVGEEEKRPMEQQEVSKLPQPVNSKYWEMQGGIVLTARPPLISSFSLSTFSLVSTHLESHL